MIIAINELSFVGQAESIHGVAALLTKLMEVLGALKVALNTNDVLSNSNLCNVLLCPEKSFHSWIHMHEDAHYDLRSFFIVTVKNGPFIDERMRVDSINCHCTHNSTDISFSSISGAAHYGGVLASLGDSGPMSDDIGIDSCHSTSDTITVKNFSSLSQVLSIDRIYRPTDKHSSHGHGTLMDLDFETAQAVLRAGFPIGDRVYGKFADKYYNFMSDNIGGYHGYPIVDFDVPHKARLFLDMPN